MMEWVFSRTCVVVVVVVLVIDLCYNDIIHVSPFPYNVEVYHNMIAAVDISKTILWIIRVICFENYIIITEINRSIMSLTKQINKYINFGYFFACPVSHMITHEPSSHMHVPPFTNIRIVFKVISLHVTVTILKSSHSFFIIITHIIFVSYY